MVDDLQSETYDSPTRSWTTNLPGHELQTYVVRSDTSYTPHFEKKMIRHSCKLVAEEPFYSVRALILYCCADRSRTGIKIHPRWSTTPRCPCFPLYNRWTIRVLPRRLPNPRIRLFGVVLHLIQPSCPPLARSLNILYTLLIHCKSIESIT
jgi:hypothetical protein